MDDLIATIDRAWGWTGLNAAQVIDRNVFGNLLVLDQDGRCWRICPEDLTCSLVADNHAELEALRADARFVLDWEMARLRDVALENLGPIADNRAYCLKIPSVLGGAYEASNIGETSLSELITASGSIARQIKDLPDGARVEFRIVE